MTSQRDELVDLLEDAVDDAVYFAEAPPSLTGTVARHSADAILAAGYRKPQQVTTIEELKALEDPEAVLVDYKHNAYQWGIGLDGSEGWQSTRDPNPITSNHLWRFSPLTVLREDKEKPADRRQPAAGLDSFSQGNKPHNTLFPLGHIEDKRR